MRAPTSQAAAIEASPGALRALLWLHSLCAHWWAGERVTLTPLAEADGPAWLCLITTALPTAAAEVRLADMVALWDGRAGAWADRVTFALADPEEVE